MTQIARRVAAAVVALALTALVAGCSSEQTAVADTPTVTTAAPLPASDFVEEDWHSFATPSQRIQCRAVDHSFACQTKDEHTVETSDLCGFYPADVENPAVRFGFFNDDPQPCATIVQGVGFHSPHTLDYGQSVAFQIPDGRTVTCSSAVDGLTCTQVGGSGGSFFLSTDSFRVL